MNVETDRLTCGADEDRIYDVVASSVEEIAKLGNVYCTNRFKNVGKTKKTNVSVGVSVSGGMLELELLTQDVSHKSAISRVNSPQRAIN